MHRRAALVAAIALFAVGAPATQVSAAPKTTTTVTYLDALSATTTDIYANGQRLAAGIEPGAVSSSFALKPGSYNLSVYESGTKPGSAAPLLSQRTTIAAGTSTTVAAYQTPSGAPVLKAFTNAPGTSMLGTLTVRHLAGVGMVDVNAAGTSVIQNLRNGISASATLPAGTVTVQPVLAGTNKTLGDSVEVKLSSKTNTVVYLWGSGSNLGVTISAPSTSSPIPTKIPAGEGDPVSRWSAVSLAASGAGAIAVSIWVVRRHRTRQSR